MHLTSILISWMRQLFVCFFESGRARRKFYPKLALVLVEPRTWRRAGMFVFVVLSCSLLFAGPQEAGAFWPFSSDKDQTETKAVEPVAEIEKPVVNEAFELTGAVRKMAEELFVNLADPDPYTGDISEGLVVTTFVDLKKLTRTSSLGRYLADQLMNEFQKKNYTVVELRKTESIFIQEKKGEYGLSRDPDKIRSLLSVGAVLTGTYTASEDHIIVNARVLDNRNATLLSGATMILPRNGFSNLLLSERTTAGSGQKELMYKKELEL